MNTSKADTLRAALKAGGYNARRVTVRYQHSELLVTVRDASVSLSAIKEIAAPFENVHRCYATGEILLGGNTYVKVEYLDALVAPVTAQMVALLTGAPDRTVIDLLGDFRAARDGERWSMSGPGFDCRNNLAVGMNWAAERIAVAYLDAQAKAATSEAA